MLGGKRNSPVTMRSLLPHGYGKCDEETLRSYITRSRGWCEATWHVSMMSEWEGGDWTNIRSAPWTSPVLRLKENWEPLETNLWELEVSQSSDFLSHADKQEKETLKHESAVQVSLLWWGSIPFQSSFLSPFSMDRCYYDRRARYWEGSKKKCGCDAVESLSDQLRSPHTKSPKNNGGIETTFDESSKRDETWFKLTVENREGDSPSFPASTLWSSVEVVWSTKGHT